MKIYSTQRALRALTLAAVTVSVVPSNAQDNEEPAIEETIVRGSYLQSSEVNALRTPTPILDVPQSLSIVTSEEILRRGHSHLIIILILPSFIDQKSSTA